MVGEWKADWELKEEDLGRVGWLQVGESCKDNKWEEYQSNNYTCHEVIKHCADTEE